MVNKNIYYFAILFLLSLLNLFLLYTNVERQNAINALNSQLIYYEDYVHRNEAEFSIINEALQFPDKNLFLITLFTDRGCASCLNYEIPNAETFSSAFNDRHRVFLVSDDDIFLKHRGVGFAYSVFDTYDHILNTEFTFSGTAAFLVDGNGVIHDVYIAEIGNQEKSDQFYSRMHSLFNSVFPGETETL